MADITITIPISDVLSLVKRETVYNTQNSSYYSEKSVKEKQDGQLREGRLFNDYLSSASNMVLNLFISRQGDVDGIPFEMTDDNIVYRLKEGTPVSSSNSAIEARLINAVKYAIFNYIVLLFSKTIGDVKQVTSANESYISNVGQIEYCLYRLHD